MLFPKAIVTSGHMEEEQWFVLQPVDRENIVSGDLRIKMNLSQPQAGSTLSTLSVSVYQARNLMPPAAGSTSSLQAVLHLLPDLRVASTQISKPMVYSVNPHIKEVFIL